MEQNQAENRDGGEDARLLQQQIGTARTVLFIVAAATFISAILLTPYLPSSATLVNLIVTAIVGIAYILLAVWTRKKPYTAIRVGLLLLVLVVVLDIAISPFGPFNRWQSKILTLLLLLLGFADSRDAQRKMSAAAPSPGA